MRCGPGQSGCSSFISHSLASPEWCEPFRSDTIRPWPSPCSPPHPVASCQVSICKFSESPPSEEFLMSILNNGIRDLNISHKKNIFFLSYLVIYFEIYIYILILYLGLRNVKK